MTDLYLERIDMFIIPENKSWVIYGIRINKDNSTYRYVGLTTTRLSERFTVHKDDSKTGTSPVNRWLRKHASEGFLVEVLSEATPGDYDSLNEDEIFWIANYRLLLGDRLPTDYSLLNIESGGNCSPIDEETRLKLSAATLAYFTVEKRQVWSERSKQQWTHEARAKISGENHHMFGKTGELCHNYGIVRSEETRAKMSKGQTGVPRPRGKVTCPHCDFYGDVALLTRFHFDNCSVIKNREILVCPHCAKEGTGVAAMKQHHFDNCRALKPLETKTCPHCGKVGTGSAMKRWHFDKCKLAPISPDTASDASPALT